MISNQRFEAVTFDYSNLEEWKSYFKEIKEIAKSSKAIIEVCKISKEKGISPWIIENAKLNQLSAKMLEKAVRILDVAKGKGLVDNFDTNVKTDGTYIYDYNKLISVINDFINNTVKILPNYNQKSLFVWTVDRLTYKYLTMAYPNLEDEKTFEIVKDILGLDVIFSPDVEDAKLRREYEIYSFKENSIGRELIELYKIIWNHFEEYSNREQLSQVFSGIRDFKREFYEMSAQALMEIKWRFPDIKVAGKDWKYYGLRGDVLKAEYRISGVTLVSCLTKGYTTTESYYDEEQSCSIHLLHLLDDLSPGLFLLNGLLFDLKIIHDKLEITTTDLRSIDCWRKYLESGVSSCDPLYARLKWEGE